MHESDRQRGVGVDSEQTGAGMPEARAGIRPEEPCREARVTIDFDEIAQGSKLVHVRFRGQVYHLRTTRNGKLILNK